MKNGLLILSMPVIIYNNSYGQIKLDQLKAEKSVINYLNQKYKKHEPVGFDKVFIEIDSIKIQEKLKTKRKIKYTIAYTFSIKNRNPHDIFFLLDENYKVIGTLKESVIDDITNYQDKIDSTRNKK